MSEISFKLEKANRSLMERLFEPPAVGKMSPVANVVAQVFSDNAQNGVFGAAVYGGAVSTVPEPAAVILVAVGLLAFVPFARRRRR